ncbi:MAG: metallopeptidase TldD-related protein [Candidatus Edwardsbacteria bacterium]
MREKIIEMLTKTSGVNDWRLLHLKSREHQLYLICGTTENLREVSTEKYILTIYNDHQSQRGMSDLTILPDDSETAIDKKIKEAVFKARLVNNPPFTLPMKQKYHKIPLVDSEILHHPQRAIEKLKKKLLKVIENKKVKLASAEFFLKYTEAEIENSQDIKGKSSGTNLFFDFVLLSKEENKESENHSEGEYRGIKDFPIEKLVARKIQYTLDSLKVVTPKSGKFTVVIAEEALLELFEPLIFHTSGFALFKKMSRFKKGESIYKDGKIYGEPLSFVSNGLLPYGTKSTPYNADGLAQQRIEIIKDGILQEIMATKQYADYLGIEPTGVFANLEIANGVNSVDELCRYQSKPLYLVVAFSSLEADRFTGNFAGEIRLGYEITKRERKPVKGGSVSGNLFEALSNAYFSKEKIFLGDYLGPQAIRFEKLTISGS